MINKGIILVVEDTSANLELLTDILEEEGFQVHPAGNGEQALTSVAANKPDLILLDIYMPNMDGFEVCRRLKVREETRSIPIIFISGARELKERVAGLKIGAVDFISKPFQREELMARIQTHLELSRLRTRLENRAMELQRANRRLQDEIAERKRMEAEMERLITELQKALSEVKVLSGLLPICAACKKIRNDDGYWEQIEGYIRDRSEAEFSHGICPECAQKIYPECFDAQ